MSPIITDGMVIAHLGGETKGSIIAFDLESGSQKWQWAGDGPAYDSPVPMTVANVKQIIMLTEKNIVGIVL
jgi:outer membrane protein assembly factor BamB